MDREQLEQFLSAYIDGELSDKERVAVEELLAADAQARAELASLRETVSLVKTLPRKSAPAGLLEDLHSQFERAELLDEPVGPVLHKRPSRSLFRPALAAAALLVVAVGGGVWVMSSLRDSQERHSLVRSNTGEKPGEDLDKARRDTAAPSAVPGRAPPARSKMLEGSPSVDRSAGLADTSLATRGISSGGEAAGRSTLAPESTPAAPAERTRKMFPFREEGSLAMTASFDQKLKAGVATEELAQHQFSNESNNLVVIVSDEADASLVETQLLAFAATRGYSELGRIAGKKEVTEHERVILEGQSDQNYIASNEKQILLRMPTEDVPDLVQSIASDPTATRASVMNVGPLRYPEKDLGEAVRQMQQPTFEVLTQMAEADVMREAEARAQSADAMGGRTYGTTASSFRRQSMAADADEAKEAPRDAYAMKPKVESAVADGEEAEGNEPESIFSYFFGQIGQSLTQAEAAPDDAHLGLAVQIDEPGTLLERSFRNLMAKQKSAAMGGEAPGADSATDKFVTMVVRIRQASAGEPATSQPARINR